MAAVTPRLSFRLSGAKGTEFKACFDGKLIMGFRNLVWDIIKITTIGFFSVIGDGIPIEKNVEQKGANSPRQQPCPYVFTQYLLRPLQVLRYF